MGAGANKAGLGAPNTGTNEFGPNAAASPIAFEPNVGCWAIEPAPNRGSSEVDVLLNCELVATVAFAPNGADCDAAIENRSLLRDDEWRLPLALAASWSDGRVGDVNVDDEVLTAASAALLDELDATCFILCCYTHAYRMAPL